MNTEGISKMGHYQTKPLITHIRDASLFVKTMATTITVAFTMLILTPTALAVQTEVNDYQQQRQQAALNSSTDAKLAHTLQQIKESIGRAHKSQSKYISDTFAIKADLDNAKKTGKLIVKKQAKDDIQAAIDLSDTLPVLHKNVMDDFDQIANMIKDKELPNVMMERHQDAVEQYEEQYDEYIKLITSLKETDNDSDQHAALTELDEFISSQQFKKNQQPFDPEHLPGQMLEADPNNVPKLDEADYRQAGIYNTPHQQIAALGDFTYANLAGASDPAYLAETDEVVISQAIIEKAAELNHEPAQIYQWVRNHIEWLPTWGSIQNADLTLTAQRGNAMDIASLTIALLRASGIPSRYAHGAIDVEVEQFKNWAGGFDNINAATQFAGNGGIPIINIVSGGQIVKTRLEHVWVEAAIDFIPSQGAKNNDADTWIGFDPSFKQYDLLEGLDAISISGIDAEQLAQEFIGSGTINETEGWVTGFDPTVLENAQSQAQQALEDYIDSNLSDPTVGDVIGGRKTIVKEFPILPAGLSNDVVVVGARYGHLPALLQQTITFAFSKDIYGRLNDPLTLKYANTNNEKVTLSFRPATAEDEAALAALLPEGEITDISQLPSTIPSYLINVIPEIRVNGVLKKSGFTMDLGNELPFITQVNFAGGRYIFPRTYNVIAGSYLSLNVVSGSVAPSILDQAKTRLEETQAILESEDDIAISTLTREQILGDMFHAGTLGYFGQLIALSHVAGLQTNGHFNLMSGHGTLGYEPNVNYLFGFPRAIKPGSVVLDIPYVINTVAGDADPEQWKQFNLQVGTLASVLEHAIPEQLYAEDDPTLPQPDAISAVKALQKAAAQGQRIYQITQANLSQALPNLNLDRVTEDEIEAAVLVGNEVIVHTNNVSVPGWTGAGYIITNPNSGLGAYKITGGSNGGELELDEEEASTMSFSALVENTATLLKDFVFGLFDHVLGSPLFGILGFFISIHDSIKTLSEECQGVLKASFLTLISILSVVTFAVGTLFPWAYAIIFGFVISLVMRQIIINQISLCASDNNV